MIDLKYFTRIESFDAKTNQVRLKDESGLTWVAPLPYVGVIREIPLDTPVILLLFHYGTRTSDDFPSGEKIKLNSLAIPIYNEIRFKPDVITKEPTLVGHVDDNGNIVSSVKVGEQGTTITNNTERLHVGNKTEIANPEFQNPDFSYGKFSKPQNYVLRFRPDFPYLLPEMMVSSDLIKEARKLISFVRGLI